MKKIILYNNEVTLVDDEDYEWLNKYSWCNIGGKYVGTHIKINNKRKLKSLHRLIMNEPKNMYVDHIDHNVLNNQKSNLRIVTHQQNCMNRRKKNRCSSRYKGVRWHKRDKKWSALIAFNKKKYSLGYFNNEEDAAIAYNERAKELFGEYAYLNEVNK